MMAKAIRIHTTGGPDSMGLEPMEPVKLAPDEVLLRQTAIGVNYIDVYYRTGLYPMDTPFTPGLEACAVVEATGEAVKDFKIGDRVAYGGGPLGAYAEYRTMPEKFLVKVPDAISDEQAASVMVQGATAHFLLRRTFRLQAGMSCLIHAAAGGVGLLLCQWAKHLGATVIGTTSSEEKAALAVENGCDHAILYTRENVVQRVRDLTGGEGVNVVYDSVGKDTFMDSLDCLQTFGLMVSYGQASGPIPPFDISQLMLKGSLFLTRPSLMHYMLDLKAYRLGIAELFELLASGVLQAHIGQTYPLEEAAQAHRDLEGRKTTGSIVLKV